MLTLHFPVIFINFFLGGGGGGGAWTYQGKFQTNGFVRY